MGRPLRGSKELDGAAWRVSVPTERGAKKRIQQSFGTEEAADAWLAAQCKLLNSGRRADPTIMIATDGPPSLTDAAWEWHRERYTLQHRGNADRSAQVRDDLTKHLLPAFADLLDLDAVSARARTLGWVRAMAGYDPGVELPVTITRTYARDNVSEMLWVLGKVLRHARLLGADVPMVDLGAGLEPAAIAQLNAMHPRRRTKRVPTLMTFESAADVARQLHVIHQFVLWLLRVAGLRISEAYGLTVGSFVDDGDWGYLLVEAQGGRRFTIRDDDEQTISVTRKVTTKTSAGYRLIALPGALTALIRLVIEAFHSDPETGEIDMAARLVPAIRSAGGGADGFRSALRRASGIDRDDSEDIEAWFIPHDLRKGYSTDLAWTPEVAELVKRRAMGHRAGSDVFTSIYTLDARLKDAMRPAAATIDSEITGTISTLIVPTAVKPSYGTNGDVDRQAYASGVLTEAGWEVDLDAEGWIGIDEAAAILGLTPQATRRLMTSEIPATKKTRGNRPATWMVSLDAVTAWRERHEGEHRIDAIAERTGRSYHDVHRTIRRLGIKPAFDDHSRTVHLDDDQAAQLVLEYQRLDRLAERAVPVATAAKLLRTSHSTVGYWLKTGRLVADPETDAARRTYVTNASINAELERRR